MNKTTLWAMGVMLVWIGLMFVVAYFMDHPSTIAKWKWERSLRKAEKEAAERERKEAARSYGIMFRSVKVFKRSGWGK